MGTKSHTVDGTIERGTATQRHIARAIDVSDGAHVVVSYSSGRIDVAIENIEGLKTILRLVDEHDATIEPDMEESGCEYSGTGRAAMGIVLE